MVKLTSINSILLYYIFKDEKIINKDINIYFLTKSLFSGKTLEFLNNCWHHSISFGFSSGWRSEFDNSLGQGVLKNCWHHSISSGASSGWRSDFDSSLGVLKNCWHHSISSGVSSGWRSDFDSSLGVLKNCWHHSISSGVSSGWRSDFDSSSDWSSES